jgi:hypothetical protein
MQRARTFPGLRVGQTVPVRPRPFAAGVCLASAALLAPLLAPSLAAAAPASPTPPPPLVRLVVRTIFEGSSASHDSSSRPVVTRIVGVSTAAARRAGHVVDVAAYQILHDQRRPARAHIDITAVLAEQDRRYLSVQLGVLTYIEGAAHPDFTIETLAFVRASGATLTAPQLFTANGRGPALRAISALVRKLAPGELGQAYSKDSIALGARPNLTDLGRLVPRPWGLEVAFDQGQVAANAAGPLFVVVPWAPLARYLAVPLPLGDAPPPPYVAGQPVYNPPTLTAVSNAILHTKPFAGARAGTFRIEDVRFALVVSPDGVAPDQAYAVARVVPVANPGNTHTVLLVGQDGDLTHPVVTAVALRSVGCATLPRAALLELQMRCR